MTLHSQASNPSHICIIMDGNGRWAKNRLMPAATINGGISFCDRQVLDTMWNEDISPSQILNFVITKLHGEFATYYQKQFILDIMMMPNKLPKPLVRNLKQLVREIDFLYHAVMPHWAIGA